MDVLIHHSGLNRTVAVPAVAAPSWCADGWQLATEAQSAEYTASVGAEQELADSEAADAEVAATAIAEIKQDSPAAEDLDTKTATAGAVETATTNKEQKP